MKISYNWLKEYLPQNQMVKMPDCPQKMGEILTSVGLEVEGIEKYEEVSNNLEGIIVGEVLSCEKHPDADKLKVTKVDIGNGEALEIVCGASNVAAGQKVMVATTGATLHPTVGEPFAIKKAKIRGIQSNGMICAEDEIGLGQSHEGIIVLPEDSKVGMHASEYYQLYSDYTIEIGLTPNRMDAMSHLGVAKDVCAYLSHHQKKELKVLSPYKHAFTPDNTVHKIEVVIEDPKECIRYAGVSISGIKVEASPKWLQNRLKSIGLKPLNNIVDITNFILHETGQPLHAFDGDQIKGNKVIIKTLAEKTPFITLDDKERKLSSGDIMICDGDETPMCIAGVFGGAKSGVSENTVNIFLESAVFNAGMIRKTLLRHDLRTEAAIRFEKGVDVSNTVNVLKRAATLIREITGGSISSEIIDVYPVPVEKTVVTLSNHYLKKISGKNYSSETVKNILKSLNFSILREGLDDIQVEVPLSNPDISLPADIIEEIMRIDGLDNIEIPATINMSPAIDANIRQSLLKEKIISWLNGNGFSEIFTNSITNSDYFDKETLSHTVKIINSLSEDLDVLRPSMLPTGLECLAYNINRKNNNLLFLEFGKTYAQKDGAYSENENLALYFTGHQNEMNWNNPLKKVDIFYVKGICTSIFNLTGLKDFKWTHIKDESLEESLVAVCRDQQIAKVGKISPALRDKFSIKQPVYFVSIDWEKILSLSKKEQTVFKPIARFPQVHRDLSIVLDKGVTYQAVEEMVNSLKIKKLIDLQLFDVFESEKLGNNKKSLAISFTFSDREKTLVDKEIDAMMNSIIDKLEKDLQAEIRRNA
ncbi:MAG: phenylalanine--tRNA ligase subunit beta [Ginsengibacter sp.]